MNTWFLVLGLIVPLTLGAMLLADAPPVRKVTGPPEIRTGWDDLLEGVETAEDWKKKRGILRCRFLELIGDAAKPSTKPPLELKVHGTETVDGAYVRELISYNVETDERGWAYLAAPLDLDGPAPAVVALQVGGFRNCDI